MFEKREQETFGIEHTIWGYIIRPGEAAMKRAAIGEIAALLCCVVFGVFAYSQWLLPGTINSVDVLPFKMAGTVVFFVLAFLCYGIARRGLITELQVDKRRAELREVYRNREGGSSLIKKYDFAAVNSVFIKRTKGQLRPDALYVDHRASGRPIFAAKGKSADLEQVKETMSHDLRSETLADMRRANARRQNSRAFLMAAE